MSARDLADLTSRAEPDGVVRCVSCEMVMRVYRRHPEEFWASVVSVVSSVRSSRGAIAAALRWASLVAADDHQRTEESTAAFLDAVRHVLVASERVGVGSLHDELSDAVSDVRRAVPRLVTTLLDAARGVEGREMALRTLTRIAMVDEKVVPNSCMSEVCQVFLRHLREGDPSAISSFAEFAKLAVANRDVTLAELCGRDDFQALVAVVARCLCRLIKRGRAYEPGDVMCVAESFAQHLGLSGLRGMRGPILRIARDDSVDLTIRSCALRALVCFVMENETEGDALKTFEEVLDEDLRLLELSAEKLDFDDPTKDDADLLVSAVQYVLQYQDEQLVCVVSKVAGPGLVSKRWQTRAASLRALSNWKVVAPFLPDPVKSFKVLLSLSRDEHPVVRLASVACLTRASTTSRCSAFTVLRAMLGLLCDPCARVRTEVSRHFVSVFSSVWDEPLDREQLELVMRSFNESLADQRNTDTFRANLLSSVETLLKHLDPLAELSWEDLGFVRDIAADVGIPTELRDSAVHCIMSFLNLRQDEEQLTGVQEAVRDIVTICTSALEDGQATDELLECLRDLDSALAEEFEPFAKMLLSCVVHSVGDSIDSKCSLSVVSDFIECLLNRCNGISDFSLVQRCEVAHNILQRAEKPSEVTSLALRVIREAMDSSEFVGSRLCDQVCGWAESVVQAHRGPGSMTDADWCELGLAMRTLGFVASSSFFSDERRTEAFTKLASCVDLLLSCPWECQLQDTDDFFVEEQETDLEGNVVTLPGQGVFTPFFEAMRKLLRCEEWIFTTKKVVSRFLSVIRKLLSSEEAATRDGLLLLAYFARKPSKSVTSRVFLEFLPAMVKCLASDDGDLVHSSQLCLAQVLPIVGGQELVPCLPSLVPVLWKALDRRDPSINSDDRDSARNDDLCNTYLDVETSVSVLGFLIVEHPEAFVVEEALPRWLDLLPCRNTDEWPSWYTSLARAFEKWPQMLTGDPKLRKQLLKAVSQALDETDAFEQEAGIRELLYELWTRLKQFGKKVAVTADSQPAKKRSRHK